MNKKIMITALILTAVTALSACGKKDAAPPVQSPSAGTAQTAGTAQPQQKVKPTFMYFVAKSDAAYDAAIAVAKELENEYGDRVKFMIQDVDENPELKERYMINQEDSPLPMKTPTLIMLDVNNDISTMGLSECTDKQTLKDAIEKALNK